VATGTPEILRPFGSICGRHVALLRTIPRRGAHPLTSATSFGSNGTDCTRGRTHGSSPSSQTVRPWLGRQSEPACAAPRRSHLPAMRKPRRKMPAVLPLMMTELALASWQTIAHRSLMMARGSCSPAEYSRMVLEKMSAATRSASALARSGQAPTWTALLAPWHVRAKANARRLRRKRPIG
jgi:hypothetical protein